MPLSEDSQSTVHVIDDDETVQKIVALWLRRLGMTTKAYLSAEEFLTTYQPQATECLLLDLQMPGISGLDLQAMLGAQQVRAPQIVISAVGDTATAVRAMRGGAIEFLEKPLDEQRLLHAVLAGLDVDRQSKRQNAELLGRIDRLTSREREVLALLVAAKTTLEIAVALAIRPGTVERHCNRVFEKLEVDSVPALIRLMLQLRR